MTVLADDDVIMNCDAERFCRIDNHLCHIDIGLRRRRIARGVVVQHGGELELRALLNQALAFAGLAVDPTGELKIAEVAQTLPEASAGPANSGQISKAAAFIPTCSGSAERSCLPTTIFTQYRRR